MYEMTNASSMTMRRTIGNCIFNFGQVMRYRSPRHHRQITVIKHHRWDSKKVTFIDCSLVYSVFLLPHLLHLRTNLTVCLRPSQPILRAPFPECHFPIDPSAVDWFISYQRFWFQFLQMTITSQLIWWGHQSTHFSTRTLLPNSFHVTFPRQAFPLAWWW